MEHSNLKAVAFDIDGTLTRDKSWNRLTLGLGGSVEKHDEIYGRWKKGEITLREANELCLINWSKENKANKKEILGILKAIPLREDAKEIMNYLKNKGYKICMITGSFSTYAEIVGEELGISDWYAISELIWDDKENLVDVETVADDKKKKIEFFDSFCKRYSLKTDDCAAVGDSTNDIDIFKLTGNGIVVKSEFEDKELEEVAWKKVDNLTQLKEIL